jgi:hypothetical protein
MATERLRFNTENRDVIERFLESGGDDELVKLNDKQKELLDRWRYADEILRENKTFKREIIANKISAKFDVSRDTAFRDIMNAEHVFLSTTPLNKKYWIQRRIEYIQAIIDKLLHAAFEENPDQKRVNENGKIEWNITPPVSDINYELAVKWEAVLQKYIAAYPDFLAPRSPKTIVFNVQQNILNTNITLDQAEKQAEEILLQLKEKDDY